MLYPWMRRSRSMFKVYPPQININGPFVKGGICGALFWASKPKPWILNSVGAGVRGGYAEEALSGLNIWQFPKMGETPI